MKAGLEAVSPIGLEKPGYQFPITKNTSQNNA
jgi:hypothetical protein